MSFDTPLLSFNVKPLMLTVVCASLSMLSYSSIAEANLFTGPTELSAQEFKELTIKGNANLKEIKADSLTVKGPLNFNKLKVTGETEVSGPFSGNEGDFSNLVIHGTFWGSKIKAENFRVDGDVSIEDFKISGTTTINGPLKAKNGSFNNIDSVHAPVALYNVTVNNITLKKSNENDNKDNAKSDNNTDNNQVKLAGNTVVSGDITFESGNGIVFIRDKTAQLKGKIIGGKLKE